MIPKENAVRILKLFVELSDMSFGRWFASIFATIHPANAPAVFVIKSFISDALYVKICANSIIKDAMNPAQTVA